MDVYCGLREDVATGTGLVTGSVLKAGGPHAAALHSQAAVACSTDGVYLSLAKTEELSLQPVASSKDVL